MDSTAKGFVGLGIVFVLIGIYVWFDHGRTLECRTTAVAGGADTLNAVKLCKH